MNWSFQKIPMRMAPGDLTPNPPTPNKGQKFNPDICNGCNACVEVCPTDVMMPNPEKKKPRSGGK
jgi:ferredoxin